MKKYLAALALTLSVSGCSTVGDLVGSMVFDLIFPPSQAESNRRAKVEYDKGVCELGPETSPYERRGGCVNSRSTLDNFRDFDRYDHERNKLLRESSGAD